MLDASRGGLTRYTMHKASSASGGPGLEPEYDAMANLDFATTGDLHGTAVQPEIRTITTHDLVDALKSGWEDFKAKPSHLVFIAIIYPICGALLAQLTVSYNVIPLLFPLIAGFALLGPFAAVGLYEISRRRERGISTSWRHAFALLRSPSIGQITELGAMLTGLFVVWMGAAWFVYSSFLDLGPNFTASQFFHATLTTFDGWIMMIVGNALGLLFAIVAFSISVVSFPMMIDKHVDAPTAIRTSVAAVEANPRVMMIWGLMVTALLALGSLPVLIGLVIVMPVLGHATWHLYRKLVAY
jgi:uncharacterized membrane protein